MPRAVKPSGKSRHDPLHIQLGEDELHAKYGKVARLGKRRKSRADEDEEEQGEVRSMGYAYRNLCLLDDAQVILDPKTSRKIFELAKDQQEELNEDGDEDEDGVDETDRLNFSVPRTTTHDDEGQDDLGEYDEDEEEEIEEIVCVLSLKTRY